MEHCTWSHEAASNESVYDVHGRKLYFYLPNNDCWYDDIQAHQGHVDIKIKWVYLPCHGIQLACLNQMQSKIKTEMFLLSKKLGVAYLDGLISLGRGAVV